LVKDCVSIQVSIIAFLFVCNGLPYILVGLLLHNQCFLKLLSNVLWVNPFHHQMVRFLWGCFNQCKKWSWLDLLGFVQRDALCYPFIATKWL